MKCRIIITPDMVAGGNSNTTILILGCTVIRVFQYKHNLDIIVQQHPIPDPNYRAYHLHFLPLQSQVLTPTLVSTLSPVHASYISNVSTTRRREPPTTASDSAKCSSTNVRLQSWDRKGQRDAIIHSLFQTLFF